MKTASCRYGSSLRQLLEQLGERNRSSAEPAAQCFRGFSKIRGPKIGVLSRNLNYATIFQKPNYLLFVRNMAIQMKFLYVRLKQPGISVEAELFGFQLGVLPGFS